MNSVLRGFLVVSFLYLSIAAAINIDDKLDFEDSSVHSNARSNIVPLKYTKSTTTVNDDFDAIGIVCTSGGCNRTVTDNSQDNVQADVVVRVETKVNLNHNKNKSDILEETPDIPIVVGYKGSQLDSTPEDGTSGLSVTPQSIYVPSNAGQNNILNSRRNYYNQPIGFRGSSSFSNNNYNPPVFTPLGSKIYPSGGNTIDNYSPAYYDSLTGTNRNVKVLSTVTNNNNGISNIKYRTNGTHTVPYFEPAYHNHYYGENPPPQYTWYPKINNNIQSANSKLDNPYAWHGTGSLQHAHTIPGQEMKCVCKNGEIGQLEPTTELRWYPSMKRTFVNDPGSQINDKLAPLN